MSTCLLAAGLALAAATPAQAQEEGGFEGFMIEIPVGLATPLSEGQWEDTADPSFVTGAAFGYMFSLGGWSAAIGPEVELTYSPVNVEDKRWGRDGGDDDVYIGRLRVTGGARFVVGFGSAYLLGRVGVGIDYAHASWDNPPVGDAGEDTDDNDTAAALLLAMGMGYMLTDWIGLTLQMEFPIGFHDHQTNLPVELDGDMLDLLATAAVTFLL
jgi:opacity protein-like surface antigen